jgi:hypothetical protein
MLSTREKFVVALRVTMVLQRMTNVTSCTGAQPNVDNAELRKVIVARQNMGDVELSKRVVDLCEIAKKCHTNSGYHN